jgi:phage terminase large subunit
MQIEARRYRFKVDRKTGDVLPVIVDADNHGWDAVRYSLDGYIQRRGANSVWARLAE